MKQDNLNKMRRNKCEREGHIKRECFNSVENKGKSVFICKNCGKKIEVVFPLDNAGKSEDE